MKPKKSIRVRLMAMVISSVVVPLGILGGVYQISVRNILTDNSKLMTSQTLDETVVKVEEYLKNLSLPLDMLAQENVLKEYVDTVGTKENKKIVTELKEELDHVHGALDGTINVYFGTPNKKLVISTNNGDSNSELTVMDTDITPQSWYQDAIGKERISGVKALFQKPYIDDVTGKTVVTLTQEVVFDGQVYGVLGIDIEFDSFEKYVQEIKLLNTGYIMISDSEGMILSDHTLSNITDVTALEESDEVIGSEKAETKKVVKAEVFEQLKVGGMQTYEVDGKTQYTAEVEEPITGWRILGVIGKSENDASISRLTTIFWSTTIFGILVACVISTLLTNFIIRVIAKIGNALKEVATGNLKIQLESKTNDEIGELENDFNQMVVHVGQLVRDVSEQTDIMVEAGAKISHLADDTTRYTQDVVQTIGQVADGAGEQANNTQQATEKVNELSVCINSSEEVIKSIEEMSIETNKLSKEGLETVETLIQKAEATKENSIVSKEVFDEMAESIQSIDYISNAIADITTQTNLLSLNASIEAARAGEAGKGFAVVADEIRQLAEQSKVSTDEIKTIVLQITEKSNVAGEKLLESNRMLEEQNQAINLTKEVFHKISDSITMLNNHMNDMMASTNEMNHMKEAVSDNITEIAAISEEYAASTQEVTAASEQVMATMNTIAEQTKELNRITDVLKANIQKFDI